MGTYYETDDVKFAIKVEGVKNAKIHETFWNNDGFEEMNINLNANYTAGKTYKVTVTMKYNGVTYNTVFSLTA